MAFLYSSIDQFVCWKTKSITWSRVLRAPCHGMEQKDKHLLSVKEWCSLSMLHRINFIQPMKQEASFLCFVGQQAVEILFSKFSHSNVIFMLL